jgi:hypothetical protein
VEEARKQLTASRAKVLTELDKKQKDPNLDCDLSQFDVVAAELKALGASVEAYNEAVAKFVTRANDYLDSLAKSDFDALHRSLAKERRSRTFQTRVEKWATDYPVVKKEAAELLRKKDANRRNLKLTPPASSARIRNESTSYLEGLAQISPLPTSLEKRMSVPTNPTAISASSSSRKRSP